MSITIKGKTITYIQEIHLSASGSSYVIYAEHDENGNFKENNVMFFSDMDVEEIKIK